MEQCDTGAFNILLHGRCYSNVTTETITIDNDVLFYHRSTKHTEPNKWRSGKVDKVTPQIVEMVSEYEKHYKTVFEDLRVRPKSDLKRPLLEETVEEFLMDERDGVLLHGGGGGVVVIGD